MTIFAATGTLEASRMGAPAGALPNGDGERKSLAMIALLIVLSLLALVVTFGVGFIVNMIAPWWTSSAVYAVLILYVLAKTGGHLKAFDWTLVCIGAVGAAASGLTIRALRRRGFRMFR